MEFEKSAAERWIIQADSYESCPRAVDIVSAALRAYLPYVVPVFGEAPEGFDGGIVRIFVDPALEYDRIVVECGGKNAEISGGNEISAMYAAYLFADSYLPSFMTSRRTAGALAGLSLPRYSHSSVPAIKSRGVWTWGHVICDYRRFMTAMARLRLNRLTIWNDFPPLNGREIVNYAHSLGIELIWGFSWGWGEEHDLSDPDSLERMRKTVTERTDAFLKNGGDGIYFQLFTETTDEYKDGRLIAAEAVKWANVISSDLLSRRPNLKICFGLHAMSVDRHLDEIEKADPRIDIIWEDCGSFPWGYDAGEYDEKTRAFTDSILRLRGGKGFGGVLKGQTNLDWSKFEHQRGPSPLGESSDIEIKAKTALRDGWIRRDQADWIKYGRGCAEAVAQIAAESGAAASGAAADRGAVLESLTEDNLIETGATLPLAIFAESCLDPHRSWEDILYSCLNNASVRLR
ncbi:MAG: hypothetical protein GX827_09855 [Clostridiales bacterium]|nr:hypothetical protein [Clostridiales bacterium]